MMRIAQFLTLIFVLALVPVTAFGAYGAYVQSQQRVDELNEITPLHKTDLEKVVRLALGVDDVETLPDTEEAASAPSLDLPFAEEISDTASTGGAVQSTEAENTPTEQETSDPTGTEDLSMADEDEPNSEQIESQDAFEDVQIDPRRKTVLLMGVDQREGEEGQFRTDTMILLSIDPVAKTGAILSIPRDIWLTIPGLNVERKINMANYEGDSPDLNYPGGGPALAMRTVENLLGVPIDHYALINFDAFTTIIDTVGPIEICVAEKIDDPKYPDGSYGYLPIVIEAGCQEMDATRLLQYSRTRATSGGDFDRAQRQQEVIMAVRQKIMSTGGVASLVQDAVPLWEAVSNNIRTDMTLDEIVALGLAAAQVNDFRQGTISTEEVLEGMGDDGSQILIPIQTDIFALVQSLFRPPSQPAIEASEDITAALDPDNLPLEVRQEGAIIALLNGTEITGRAGSLSEYVMSYSLDVGTVGNASSQDVTATYIIYYGDHLTTADYLSKVLAGINGNNLVPIEPREGENEQGDVLVVIGTDLAVPQTAEN